MTDKAKEVKRIVREATDLDACLKELLAKGHIVSMAQGRRIWHSIRASQKEP